MEDRAAVRALWRWRSSGVFHTPDPPWVFESTDSCLGSTFTGFLSPFFGELTLSVKENKMKVACIMEHDGTQWIEVRWDFLIWAFNTSFSKFAGHERSYLTATRSTPQARQPPSWTSVIFKPSKMSFSEKKISSDPKKNCTWWNIIKVPTQNNIK